MERKIFNSRESRIKRDLDLTPCCWWLRSREGTSYSYQGYVYFIGNIAYTLGTYSDGIVPICAI